MLSRRLLMAASANVALDVGTVFSTDTYTGNGSTQSITNGIDLSGEGGLVWGRARAFAVPHNLHDTERGAERRLSSDSTGAEATRTGSLTSFNTTGFSVGSLTDLNESSRAYVAWTFRKAPKFFDVVTYTGTGSARTVAHSLGSVPGMIIVKRTNTAGFNWFVYHRGIAADAETDGILLNGTGAAYDDVNLWNDTAPTDSSFTLGTSSSVNQASGEYVAYLFAHDTSDTGIIQCGSYTGTGAGGNNTTLGWKPQWIMLKQTDGGGGDWEVVDEARTVDIGWTWDASSAAQRYLSPNTSGAEDQSDRVNPLTTGFEPVSSLNTSSASFVYVAIRAEGA